MTERTRRRIGTVILAPAAALLTWGCIRLAGIDLVVKTGDGTVGPVDVVVASLIGALGGWFAIRLLERYTSRPWLWWPARVERTRDLDHRPGPPRGRGQCRSAHGTALRDSDRRDRWLRNDPALVP